LTNYERLLRLYADELRRDEFNPHQTIPLMLLRAFSPSVQMRFWKRTRPIFKVPNTLGQDLAGGTIILQELEKLDDKTLHGVAECNHINYRRLLQRSAFGFFPRVFGVVVIVLGVAKTIKETIGFDKFAVLPSAVWDALIWLAVGLVLGSISNLVVSLPMLGMVLDDLIAITIAYRGTPKPER
jgi:hypothetical protein